MGREASGSVVRNPFLQEGNVELLWVVEGMGRPQGRRPREPGAAGQREQSPCPLAGTMGGMVRKHEGHTEFTLEPMIIAAFTGHPCAPGTGLSILHVLGNLILITHEADATTFH